MSGDHYLIVPPEGLLEIVHANQPIDVEATLRARGEGTLFRLHQTDGTAEWLVNSTGRLNPRATTAFAMLTGASFSFVNTVIIYGMDEKILGRVVGELSTRGPGWADVSP